MNRKKTKALLPSRISLSVYHPLVSLVMAVSLIGVFLGASLWETYARSRADSYAQTEWIAAIVSGDLATGQTDRIKTVIGAEHSERLLLLDAKGRRVAGELPASALEDAIRLPVAHGGKAIGTLVSKDLVPFRLRLPLWLILVLCSLAISVAVLFGRLYSQRLVSGLQEIEDEIDWLLDRKGSPPSRFKSFVELQRLRARVHRAIQSLSRERDGLRRLAYRHPVTGLPNQGAMQKRLASALQGADYDAPVCFMLLDIDRFGRACEMLGAAAGNEILRLAAQRINEELEKASTSGLMRPGDTLLSHFHADDFGLLLSGISSRKDASTLARALRAAFVKPFDLNGRRVSLGLSGGIVIAPEDGDEADDLLRRAGIALSSLREEGRSGFRFFAPRLDRVAKGRLQLETDIRVGLARNEFEPHFQPKIDFRTGRIAGCEALARWNREGGRSVPPGAFIPVAEESGLIDEIGQTILERACVAAAGWLRDGMAIPVAVNVSPSQVARPDFRDIVIDTITKAGLPPRFLELEVTESVAVSDPKKFENVMHPLKAMGVRLAIDDFGTGHSNLSILSRLNFDVFKIDRQFIAGLDGDDSAPAIVEMILAMGESLGLETVAEGIETPEQARFLRRRGCTLGQGFLYSRALAEREFRDFVDGWNRRRGSQFPAQAG